MFVTAQPQQQGDSTAQSSTPSRGRFAAWAFYDWGGAAINAVIISFVFSVYVATAVADPAPGELSGETMLSISTGLAGLVVALLAPVMGQRADARGKRKANLAVWTVMLILTTSAMVFVKQDSNYLLLGLVLLGLVSIFNELSSVSYYAMLRQVSTPATVGRASGIGWAMGYVGGIVLLLGVLVVFINPNISGVTSEGGLNIRLVALVSAAWFGLFAIPLFIAVPEIQITDTAPKQASFFQSYKVLWRDLVELFRIDRNVVKFFIASALYRDGLVSVFAFGAVLAKSVYGLSAGEVILFGVAANIVAAAGALVAGFIEDRVGPKSIINVSLAGLITSSTILLFVEGKTLFWIFGLALTLWVGPAQAASRSFLARMAPVGHEGQMFGLYATTGRAVSFLGPALFALFSWLFDAPRAGIVGIAVVLIMGALALFFVSPPGKPVALHSASR